MLVGFDADEMNMAVTTGTNAAENNAFWLVVIAIYKAVDIGVAIYDSYQLVKEFTSEETTDQRRQEIAQQLMVDGALSALGTRSAKKLYDVIEDKLGIAKEVLRNKLKDMLPNNGPQLETAGRANPKGQGSRVDADPNMYSQSVAQGSRGIKLNIGRGGVERTFEKNSKHDHIKRGNASAEPKNPQELLNNSFQLPGNTTRWISVDKENSVFAIFDEHTEGCFHGHVRSWNGLDQKQQALLIKLDLTNKKGKILK